MLGFQGLRFPSELGRHFPAARQLLFHRSHLVGRSGEMNRQFCLLLHREIALRERLPEFFALRRCGLRRLVGAVGLSGLLLFDQADFHAASRADADRGARDDGHRAFDQILAEESAIGAVEVPHEQALSGDDNLGVPTGNSLAVEHDVAGVIPANSIFARIEHVMPEVPWTVSDDDFSLDWHRYFPPRFKGVGAREFAAHTGHS